MQQRTVPETDTPAAVEKTAPIVLSRRSKEAIKVALAMVMVYAIAMQMGWDKPYWAGFTVVTINVLSAGVSLTRGLARSLGTLAGAVAGLAIIALFPQDRWLLMICVSLYLALCTYLLTGKNQSYFWFLAAFTGLIIIGVSSPPDPQSVFQVAVLRTQETAMGAVVYTLIAAFLWPTSSEGLFNGASRKLWATQTQLYRAYRDLMSGNGSAADTRSLRLQEIQLLAQVGGLLGAAESDSYAVWEVRHRWRQFHEQSHAFMKALERWRASFADVRSLDLEQFLPDVAAMNAELDRRFEQIGRMLADKAPTHPAQTITLNVDRDAMDALGHFQRAALVVTQTQLENLERISRSLYECLADIKGYAPRGSAGAMEPPAPWRLTLDADRIRTVVRVLVTQWLAFLLWVYIDPPGHSAFPMLAGIFALIIAMVPQASGALLFITWGGGIALAGVLYVLVMPHLSGFAEVAVMVFGVFFVLQYLLGDLRLTVARMFTMASFLILINIDNQQTYNFAAYANGVAWILLSLGLALATAYIPSSPRPEKVFLRLLRRYFRHAGFLLEGIAPERPEKTGLVRRLQATLSRQAREIRQADRLSSVAGHHAGAGTGAGGQSVCAGLPHRGPGRSGRVPPGGAGARALTRRPARLASGYLCAFAATGRRRDPIHRAERQRADSARGAVGRSGGQYSGSLSPGGQRCAADRGLQRPVSAVRQLPGPFGGRYRVRAARRGHQLGPMA